MKLKVHTLHIGKDEILEWVGAADDRWYAVEGVAYSTDLEAVLAGMGATDIHRRPATEAELAIFRRKP